MSAKHYRFSKTFFFKTKLIKNIDCTYSVLAIFLRAYISHQIGCSSNSAVFLYGQIRNYIKVHIISLVVTSPPKNQYFYLKKFYFPHFQTLFEKNDEITNIFFFIHGASGWGLVVGETSLWALPRLGTSLKRRSWLMYGTALGA